MSKTEQIMFILRDVVRDGTGNREFLEKQAKKIIAVMGEGNLSDNREDTEEPTV